MSEMNAHQHKAMDLETNIRVLLHRDENSDALTDTFLVKLKACADGCEMVQYEWVLQQAYLMIARGKNSAETFFNMNIITSTIRDCYE